MGANPIAVSSVCGESAAGVCWMTWLAGAAGGAGLIPMRRAMICWRLSSRRVGFAGLCSRGLMIAPASSAASSGASDDAGFP
jgi:hypothetical protein